MKPEGGVGFLRAEVTLVVSHLIWILGTKPGSYGIAIYILNHCASLYHPPCCVCVCRIENWRFFLCIILLLNSLVFGIVLNNSVPSPRILANNVTYGDVFLVIKQLRNM